VRLTATQAAAHIGRITGRRPHVSTVIRWITRGRLPAIRQGGVWLIDQADVVRFLQPAARTALPPPAVTAARLELERMQLDQLLGKGRGDAPTHELLDTQ
jgi:excisionase family DNA binding protein